MPNNTADTSFKSLTSSETSIAGLYKVEFKVISDNRGSIMESYRESDYQAAGLPSLNGRPQVNATLSIKGTLRGIHAEETHKFLQIAQGKVYAVIVDLRKQSSTAGKWLAFELSRGQGLFVSKGLGNSFQSISSEPSIYLYYFENEWQPGMVGTNANPLDPELAIPWPVPHNKGMIISDKDAASLSIAEALS